MDQLLAAPAFRAHAGVRLAVWLGLWSLHLTCTPLVIRGVVAIVCEGVFTTLFGVVSVLALIVYGVDFSLLRRQTERELLLGFQLSRAANRMIIPATMPLLLGGRPYLCVLLFDVLLGGVVGIGLGLGIWGCIRNRRQQLIVAQVANALVILLGLSVLVIYLRGSQFRALIGIIASNL